jgi:cysteine dioxygenase
MSIAEQSNAFGRAHGKLRTLIEQLTPLLAGAGQVPVDVATGRASLPAVDTEAVLGLLRDYAAHVSSGDGFGEIRPYLFWSDVHYTRNLVFSCDDFELIVLCWGVSHGSRVHNHASSHCWLSVLNSTVSEQRFVPAVVSPSTRQLSLTSEAATPALTDDGAVPPMLVLTSEGTLDAGSVSYINDEIALHRVAAFHTSVTSSHAHDAKPSLTPFGAVTLHVYSPPIRRVKIYEPGRGVYVRTPGFFSIDGQKH